MKFKNSNKNDRPRSLKAYLKTSNELNEERNEDVEHLINEVDEQSPKSKKNFFWNDWSTRKKWLVAAGSALGTLLALFLVLNFWIKPNKTNGFIMESWHEASLQSKDLERKIDSNVDLENTRILVDAVYDYNKVLAAEIFNSESVGGFFYDDAKVEEYRELLKGMEDYFNKSATLLSKVGGGDNEVLPTSESLEDISDEDVIELDELGKKVFVKVEELRTSRDLGDSINEKLFDLDMFIANLRLKRLEINQQRLDEQARKEDEQKAAAQKILQDEAEVDTVINIYGKAFINGNESGVRAVMTEGYQNEFDFDILKAENRSTNYPDSFRVLSSEKDGSNYKVIISMVYVSAYNDENGVRQEDKYPNTESYRLVYSESSGTWKIDGRIFN